MELPWRLNYTWRWTALCPTGLDPFAQNSTDLLPCFQEIVLQMPIYTIFLVLSTYYFALYSGRICRNRVQLVAINLRAFISILMSALPAAKILVFYHNGLYISAADILVVFAEGFLWIVHSSMYIILFPPRLYFTKNFIFKGYLLSLRRNGTLSPRGHLYITVLWSANVTVDIIWLYFTRKFSWWSWGWATLLLDLCYSLTLIPKGQAFRKPPEDSNRMSTESTPLLAYRYTRFQFNYNEAHLGHAHDEATLKSRLLFQWVSPLISKGVAGNLRRIEDLFDLPECLCVHRLNDQLQSSLTQFGNIFTALHSVFGKEFYTIGILRFVADISSFAGPLLLGGLLNQETGALLFATEEKSTNWTPYLYALGLFSTQVLCKYKI